MTRPPHLRSCLHQRHARGAGRRRLAGARPDPDRRGDQLRHDQRHQHGAALPQRRPRGGPTRRPSTAWGTSSPTAARRCASSSCTASSRSRAIASSPRATTTTSSIPIAPRAPTCSASSRSASPHGGRVLRLAAHAVHGRAAVPAAWPRSCSSWAPRTSGAAATAAGRPRQRGTRPLEPRARRPRPPGALRRPRADHLHHLRGGRARLPGLRRARLHAAPRPSRSRDKTPYTEKVSFGYHAKAAAGPVYPDGVVSTGDPIFVKLVRRVRVKAHYRLEAAAAHRVGGTMEVAAAPRRARRAGAAPSSSPRPSASRATTPPPT